MSTIHLLPKVPRGWVPFCLVLMLPLFSGCNGSAIFSSAGADGGDGSGSAGPSPYIAEVFSYRYGIGQHAESVGTAEEEAAGFLGTGSDYVRLGGWGGNIVAGFDHDVPNGEGYDLAVYTQPGYGSEPGVVYVKPDTNGNGQPDGPDSNERWYELSGSETGEAYGSAAGGCSSDAPPADCDGRYRRDYRVTFFAPETQEANITWEDNQGASGEIVPGFGEESSASWWWNGYGDVDRVTFRGVKLPDNKYQDDGGTFLDYPSSSFPERFAWGYAENYGAEDLATLRFGDRERGANRFDLGDAIDAQGDPVDLEAIRFIKVQTGVFLIAGELNEVSTEVSGAADLHMLDGRE